MVLHKSRVLRLLGNDRRKQRDRRRKVEYNTQGLHTMESVISSLDDFGVTLY